MEGTKETDNKAAAKYEKILRLTMAHASYKVLNKISKPVRLNDGLYPASVIVESVNWQRSLIRDVSPSVFDDAFWSHISPSQRVVKKLGNGKVKYSGVFYTLKTFAEFWEAAFRKRYVLVKERIADSSSAAFVCPYGLLQKPTILNTDLIFLREVCSRSGLNLLEIDTSVSEGRLICRPTKI